MNRLASTLVTYSQCAAVLLLAAGSSMAAETAKKPSSPMEFFNGEPADLVYPKPHQLLMNAQGRDYTSLNGQWGYFVDESGMSWNIITLKNYYEDDLTYPDTGMNLQERSFNHLKQLTVPGDWNSQVAELDRYRGKVVYQKSVDLQPQSDKRYFLHFDGANYTTDLFVNNQLVGRHIGGYTAFNFEVTNYVQAGQNSVIVRVDAHLDDDSIPTMRTSDFWKYGGLTRDVGIIETSSEFISQYHVFLDDLDSLKISGWVQLDGRNLTNQPVTVQIPELGKSIQVSTDETGKAEFAFTADELVLWSPSNPKLYDVSLTFNDTTLNDEIGFRSIATDGLNILLNGKPIKLRGIGMHEETILRAGLANSPEDAEASLSLIKELNANFVRLAHYPHNEHTLKLADKKGLMVWSEVPIVSAINWENDETLSVAKSQVTENITRDLNRASIFTWSVSNESFPSTQARLDFLTELVDTARSLDDSHRPISSALIGNLVEEFAGIGKHLFMALLRSPDVPQAAKDKMIAMSQKMAQQAPEQAGQKEPHVDGIEYSDEIINITNKDKLGEVVDIVGYNEYFGWYYSKSMAESFGIEEGIVRDAMLSIMPKIRFNNVYRKPMIISEFGAGAKYGLRSDKALIWSEEYQAKVYQAQLNMLEKSTFVQGTSPWLLMDFRSHLRELNGIQDTYNRKGVVSESGEKKLAFDVLSSYYGKQSD